MKRLMLDLETMHTVPGSSIVSIGACVFDENGIEDEKYYALIKAESCDEIGLKVSESTMRWWLTQPAEVLVALTQMEGRVGLREGIEGLFEYYKRMGCQEIWSNGADFDIPIIANVCDILGIEIPYKHWEHRCYRTMKSLFAIPKPAVSNGEVAHKAVDDAILQAAHCMLILKWVEPLVVKPAKK